MGTRAAQKLRELIRMADTVILHLYGLEKEWKKIESSRQWNDQWQDQNENEASWKKFSDRVQDLLDEDKLLHPNQSVSQYFPLYSQDCG